MTAVFTTYRPIWHRLHLAIVTVNCVADRSQHHIISCFIKGVFTINPILGKGGVDCGFHPCKHLWIFQKRVTVRIWDFLTFNIYYLGPFSQNFRSVSLFLRKLEPFCRSCLEKFGFVAKIKHLLPYRCLKFCQTKYTMDAVLLYQQNLW